LLLVLLACPSGASPQPPSGPGSASADEVLLRSVGLTPDGPQLVAFFRLRSAGTIASARLAELIDRLGSETPAERDRACADLTAVGPPAIPALRQAARDRDQAQTAELAQRCLRALESDSSNLTLAALRLLAQRRPDGAAGAILAFLPTAEDEAVLEEARKTLALVAFRDGKVDPALEKALEDRAAVRRAAVIDVLTQQGRKEPGTLLRRLLRDPAPGVRVRAALALASIHDTTALPILIDLLGELPLVQGKQVEEFLVGLAGESAPKIVLADDNVSRRNCREAWLKWWQEPPESLSGPVLLEELRKRTTNEKDRVKIQSLIEALGDDSFEAREKATSALKALGEVATPLLRLAARSQDPEVNQRAKAVLQEIDRNRTPPPAPLVFRLLALRRPAGTAEVLLNFLPFAEDDGLVGEAQYALNAIASQEGKPDPALVRALEDKAPLRRAAAAEALCYGRSPEGLPAVRKLLQDQDVTVRSRAALALAGAQQREAIPVLIALMGTLPADQAFPIEDYLRNLVADRLPAVEGDDRKKLQEVWSAWWLANGARIELPDRPPILASSRVLGYTLLVQPQNNQVVELDQAGKVRWTIAGLGSPQDARVLPGDRVLIAEYGGLRVTERNLKGEILWQKALPAAPINVQRLPNGNTFVAARNLFLEIDRGGKEVLRVTRPLADVMSGWRAPDGQILCLTSQGMCIRMDRTGKELKSFRLQGISHFGNELLPNGNLLVPLSWQNKVMEYDPSGKVVWEANAIQPMSAVRLPSGNTLISCQQWPAKVIELDKTGKQVAEIPSTTYTARVRRR